MRQFAKRIMTIARALIPIGALAQNDAEMSIDQIAKELVNPNTSLGSLNFDYINYKGDLPSSNYSGF
jgi:hypothetical protein